MAIGTENTHVKHYRRKNLYSGHNYLYTKLKIKTGKINLEFYNSRLKWTYGETTSKRGAQGGPRC